MALLLRLLGTVFFIQSTAVYVNGLEKCTSSYEYQIGIAARIKSNEIVKK